MKMIILISLKQRTSRFFMGKSFKLFVILFLPFGSAIFQIDLLIFCLLTPFKIGSKFVKRISCLFHFSKRCEGQKAFNVFPIYLKRKKNLLWPLKKRQVGPILFQNASQENLSNFLLKNLNFLSPFPFVQYSLFTNVLHFSLFPLSFSIRSITP